MEISNYDVLEEIGRHGPYVVYRGRRQNDRRPVLLEAPWRVPLHRTDNDALERQFELVRGLMLAGIPRAHDLVHDADRTCLVLQDRGLTPLRDVLRAGRLDLSLFLDIAVRMCSILHELHVGS